MRAAPRRSGFTLLEVILASTIALMLTAALYTAMNMELARTEDGRTAVERVTIVRSVLNRITADITASLTQISGNSSGGGSGDPLELLDSELAALSQIIGTNTPFQAGVVGGASTLTVYLTHIPSPLPNVSDDPTEPKSSTDLRRVTYWIADGGLAREEILWLTSEEAQSGLGGGDGSTDFVIAPEVTGIQFQYWDGSGWVDSWDGSMAGPDGVTPLGPPRAIAVTLQIVMPGTPNSGGEQPTKTFRHVIAVSAASGPAYAGQGIEQGAMP